MSDRVVKEAGEYVKRDRGKLRPSQIFMTSRETTRNNEMLHGCFLFLFFPVYVTLSLFPVPPPLTLTTTYKHLPAISQTFTRNLLGLGDEQGVCEEEKVSLLDLQAGL